MPKMINEEKSRVFCVLPAAGVGKRMGESCPKQYLLLESMPIIFHTISVLEKSPDIDAIHIVSGLGDANTFTLEDYKKAGFSKVMAVVEGGCERQESVYNGIASLPAEDDDLVIIHDAVRPFVTHDMISSCLEKTRELGGAIVALPVTDTLKEVVNGRVCGSLDRELYYKVQTPQCFRYRLIFDAHKKARNAGQSFTDDSGLFVAAGGEVGVVLGRETNIKITTPSDLLVSQAVAKLGL